MSLQIMRNEQSLEHSSRATPTSTLKNEKLKVFIPYDAIRKLRYGSGQCDKGGPAAGTRSTCRSDAGMVAVVAVRDYPCSQRSSNEAADFCILFLCSGTERVRRGARSITRG